MKKGQSLIEILIVIMLLAILIPPLFMVIMASRDGKIQQSKRLEATTTLKKTQEALRIIRESGWSYVDTPGTYHPVLTGSTWNLSAGTEVSNGIITSVEIFDVNRLNNQIVESGGTYDPSTKRIVTTVSWTDPLPSTISSTMYLTRYLENGAYLQTTQAEFNTGTLSSVVTTNTSGGEIQLSQNTKGQWCDPHLAPVTIDLPGKPIAVTAIEGHVYVATGETAQASQDSFAHVLVANTDPPSFSLHGKLKGYQTNAVFGETDWGYIATTNNTKEVVIVNLNAYSDEPNKIYQEAGYFNTTTNSGGSDSVDANAIYVYNDRGYVTAGSYLYVFNLSSKTGSRAKIGNRIQIADSGDRANEIFVRQVGSSLYAFVAVEGGTVEEMKIVNVTNHTISSQWRVIGGLNIEPNNCSTLESGQAIYVNPDGDRAFLSSVNDNNFKEFFVINTSTKTSPSLIGGFATNPPCTNGGGYEAGGMNPEQSVVVGIQEDRAILVGTDAVGGSNSEEYQVLNLSNEATPSKCGAMQFDQGIFGIAAIKETDGDAYAYLITGDTANELKVVQGGPDGYYVESGTYESPTADADFSYSRLFNYFEPETTIPTADTTLRFQIAIADPVSNSCTNANYVFSGPDGTTNTYYTSNDMIALDDNGTGYENPGRCLKYRAFFDTADYNQTPILEQVIINYSP